MIREGVSAFRDKNVLLLQGPIGPFFRRLSLDLKEAGARVYKVNFNGGDLLFYPSDAYLFRGRMEDWPTYFESLLDKLHIDVVMLFGDCRPIHEVAHAIAHRHGLEIGVFEEGYIRPDFITLERFGVNNYSQIPRIPEFYLKKSDSPVEPTVKTGNTFWFSVLWAMLYYFSASLAKPLFLHYKHHRRLTWLEAFPGLRSLWRKAYYAIKERAALRYITNNFKKHYYLVPLQVHNDSQVVAHSDFDSVVHFIEDVMTSFVKHSPPDTILVIKHHPMDRGYHDYSELIRLESKKLGLEGRCLYIHDQHLPTLLEHARGVVVINSTVGLSALHHGTPLKVTGNAIYDMVGMTFQGELDYFWRYAHLSSPDRKLVHAFNNYLIQHTQLNGSFYKRLPNTNFGAGLRWKSAEIGREFPVLVGINEVESATSCPETVAMDVEEQYLDRAVG